MKNCPLSIFFETPALDWSLVNFSCSGSSVNFCSYSRNKLPCTSASVWETGLAVRNSCRYHHWFQILIRGGLPCTWWVSGLFFWNNCAKNQFNGFITTVEVNGFHSFPFAFQFSSFQGAAGTNYRMSSFGKVEHNAFSSVLPFSIRFVDMDSVPFLLGSRPWKRPMSSRESSSILSNSESIRNTIFFVSSLSPINVIVHRHEDDPSFEVLWVTLRLSHHLLNLVEDSQCCASRENCPLELHRLTIKCVQSSVFWWTFEPRQSVFPCIIWLRVLVHLSKAKHRIWET